VPLFIIAMKYLGRLKSCKKMVHHRDTGEAVVKKSYRARIAPTEGGSYGSTDSQGQERGSEGRDRCRHQVSFIDGEKGILIYRGYRIEDLAEKSSFPEVAYSC